MLPQQSLSSDATASSSHPTACHRIASAATAQAARLGAAARAALAAGGREYLDGADGAARERAALQQKIKFALRGKRQFDARSVHRIYAEGGHVFSAHRTASGGAGGRRGPWRHSDAAWYIS